MKTITATLAALMISGAACAEESWKDEAIKEIATLDDVVEAMWADSGALWLSTDKEEQYLPFYTEQVVCAQAYFAEKPKGEILQITWFSARDMAQGKMERITSIFCKW